MSTDLQQLELVQEHDIRIDSLTEEKSQTPRELLEAAQERERLAAALEQREAEQMENNREMREGEMNTDDLRAKRKAAGDSALRAETSKEISQFQNQELQFATRLQELEEDLLPVMERQMALDEEVTSLRDQLAELDPRLQELQAAEDARLAGLDSRIAEESVQRDALAGNVDPALLKTYEQVRRARRGTGIARISDGRCAGCNVVLPMHVIQKVRQKKGIIRCPSCGRMLSANSQASA